MSPRVTVVGGGTMGLASAWALARRGARVEVFERFGHVHALGSHGGHTRVFRHAYHEGADYVELVNHADREWSALAERRGEALLVRCGLLEFGPPEDPEFAAALASLREHEIRHQLLEPGSARERFGFEIPPDWLACLSPDSGYLRVQACLDALRREAEDAGATVHHHTRVREIVSGEDRPRILLDDGRVVSSDHLVVAAGAWAPSLVPTLRASGVEVMRRVLVWTRPSSAERREALARLPTWGAFVPEGFCYGFPLNDEGASEGIVGFKLACHSSSHPDASFMNEPVDPDRVEREVQARDLGPLRAFLARYRPDAGEIVAAKTCLYTPTRSGDFWIDHLPSDPRVVLAAGFSGHGFKFAPSIGISVAQLVLDRHSELSLPRFRSPEHM